VRFRPSRPCGSPPGDSDGDIGQERGRPGPCPAAPCRPYGASTPLRSQTPRGKIDRRCRWQQGAHWLREEHAATFSPPRTRFARARVPAEPLLTSLNSVAAVFRFQSGDQRLISRDANPKSERSSRPQAEPSAAERNASRPTGRWDDCFAAALMERRCLLRRQVPLDPMGPDGLR
jgi:hypothetical protein